jgi:hypothetical protein
LTQFGALAWTTTFSPEVTTTIHATPAATMIADSTATSRT